MLGVTLFLACLAWWANASGWDLAIARALFNPALDDFPLHTNRWLELIGHRMVLALPIGIGLGAIAVAAASYRIPAWRSLRGPALALALTCMAGQLAITQLKHYTTLPRPYDLDTLGGYTPIRSRGGPGIVARPAARCPAAMPAPAIRCWPCISPAGPSGGRVGAGGGWRRASPPGWRFQPCASCRARTSSARRCGRPP